MGVGGRGSKIGGRVGQKSVKNRSKIGQKSVKNREKSVKNPSKTVQKRGCKIADARRNRSAGGGAIFWPGPGGVPEMGSADR